MFHPLGGRESDFRFEFTFISYDDEGLLYELKAYLWIYLPADEPISLVDWFLAIRI